MDGVDIHLIHVLLLCPFRVTTTWDHLIAVKASFTDSGIAQCLCKSEKIRKHVPVRFQAQNL